MSNQLVEFELEDGSIVVFETGEEVVANDVDDDGMQRISRGSSGDATVQKAQQRFNEVAARIRPAAQVVLDALREMNSPKEITLEFGLKFSAQTGVVIASAGSEVNFKIVVKWENPGG